MVLDMIFAAIALLFVVGAFLLVADQSMFHMSLGEAIPFALGFAAYAASGIWIGRALLRGSPAARTAQVAWCMLSAGACAWRTWTNFHTEYLSGMPRVYDEVVLKPAIVSLVHLGMIALLFTPGSKTFFARASEHPGDER